MSVTGAHLPAQSHVLLGGGRVQTDDGDGLALGGVSGGDRVEGPDGGGVPDVRVGQVDDDVFRVSDVVELVDQVVAGGEEQFATDGVDAGVLVRVGDVDDLSQVKSMGVV